MAYTIKIHNEKVSIDYVSMALANKIKSDGRFTCTFEGVGQYFHKGSKEGSRKPGYGFIIRNVRLTKKKPYCGQHFGECVINPTFGPQKKKNMRYLEYSDWIDFHGVVNDVLDELELDADIWTDPMECKGKYWIRKGLSRRVNFDAERIPSNHWAPQYKWDNGSGSQFANES